MKPRWLSWLPHKNIGWAEIGERFIRYEIVKSRWGNLYLHRLTAELPHPQCHDHPWWFVSLVLKGGYNEFCGPQGWKWRAPGTLLWRPAKWSHNVTTDPAGMWSLVLTGPKSREWSLRGCVGHS